jgi:hypothetical protein
LHIPAPQVLTVLRAQVPRQGRVRSVVLVTELALVLVLVAVKILLAPSNLAAMPVALAHPLWLEAFCLPAQQAFQHVQAVVQLAGAILVVTAQRLEISPLILVRIPLFLLQQVGCRHGLPPMVGRITFTMPFPATAPHRAQTVRQLHPN